MHTRAVSASRFSSGEISGEAAEVRTLVGRNVEQPDFSAWDRNVEQLDVNACGNVENLPLLSSGLYEPQVPRSGFKLNTSA